MMKAKATKPHTDQLRPAPFRPSGLRQTYTPPHVRGAIYNPTTSIYINHAPQDASQQIVILTNPPQMQPMHWTWRCHICRSEYRLGVTRRCLDDGHYFCAGEIDACTTSEVRRYGEAALSSSAARSGQSTGGSSGAKRKRGKACSSEFDYTGWLQFGEWRRKEILARLGRVVDGDGREGHSCERDCDYPSECEWSKAVDERHRGGGSGIASVEEVLGLDVGEDRVKIEEETEDYEDEDVTMAGC